MSPVTEAMIVNGVVLVTVLASDIGPSRRIGMGRLIRPVIASAVIIPLFVDSPVTHGRGLLVEVAGVVAGLLGGLVAATLIRVYRNPGTGKPVSSAGWAYGLFWTAVIAARAAFTYGAAHWFSSSMVSWAIANQVSQAAITDGLILMAIAMILVRTGSLRVRAAHLPVGTPALANGQLA